MDPTPLQSALASAPDRASKGAARPEVELFRFRVGGMELAFGAAHVREVVRVGPLTPLPRTPAFLMGVCGHRGEVLPVIDLLRFLQKGEMKPALRSRLVVGIHGTFVAAFMADQVDGLARVPVELILPAPIGGDAAGEHLDGVIQRSEAEGGALHLLNLPRLLGAVRQRVVTR